MDHLLSMEKEIYLAEVSQNRVFKNLDSKLLNLRCVCLSSFERSFSLIMFFENKIFRNMFFLLSQFHLSYLNV